MCKSTWKAPKPVRFYHGDCVSVTEYRPKYCSTCKRDKCCGPGKTRTITVEFKCSDDRSTVEPVMWIKNCQCHKEHRCPWTLGNEDDEHDADDYEDYLYWMEALHGGSMAPSFNSFFQCSPNKFSMLSELFLAVSLLPPEFLGCSLFNFLCSLLAKFFSSAPCSLN